MKRVLFVNHRTRACGVQQAGFRYFEALKQSARFECHYIDVDEGWEFEHWADVLKPAAVIYNFYSAVTMPWMSRDLVEKHRGHFRQLSIYHELDLSSFRFDLLLHQDPTTEDAFPHWKLPRAIPEWNAPIVQNDTPAFGSFGFGLGGKGYSDLVERVQDEYDDALIRLHIPSAAFGDAEGRGAENYIEDAKKRIKKKGIILQVSRNFLSQTQLLHWLSQHDCNVFPYEENYGRGIASVTDYALAVKRPIAITRSCQFRHLWTQDESFLLEEKSLREIIGTGTAHLDKFHQMWSRKNLTHSFEAALESLGL